MAPRAVFLGFALAVCAACHPNRTSGTAADSDPTPAAAATPPKNPAASPSVQRRPGVSHAGAIDQVAVSHAGKAALTRDTLGLLRVWTAIDGSVEPQPVPSRLAVHFSIEADGQGWLVATVDTSGGVRIFNIDKEGHARERGSLPATARALEAHVLPNGAGVLLLARDHSIVLVSPDGKELAQFRERRFQPSWLALANDDTTFVAFVPGGRGSAPKLEAVRLRVSQAAGAWQIARVGSPTLLKSTQPFERGGPVLSPSGKKIAFVAQGTEYKWEIAVADLDKGTSEPTMEVELASELAPTLGFVSERQVFASSNGTANSWLVDIVEREARPREPLPADFTTLGRVVAAAPGVTVASYGSFLYVYNIPEKRGVFLGYGQTGGQSVAISPSGERVAWAFNTGVVHIDVLGTDNRSETVELAAEPTVTINRVRFLDEDHLLRSTNAGELAVIRWRDGSVLHRTGLSTGIRELDYDPSQQLLLTQSNNVRIYELTPARGFVGPYLLSTMAYRAGILDAHGDPDKPIVWVLDTENKIREISLATLRKDLPASAQASEGSSLASGELVPLAVARDGTRYGMSWNSGQNELVVGSGTTTKRAPIGTGNVSAIALAPAGDRLAALLANGSSAVVQVFDAETLKPQWSYAAGQFPSDVTWSPDGKQLALIGATGGVVLDADSGKPAMLRCGLAFRVEVSSPSDAFAATNLASICEP